MRLVVLLIVALVVAFVVYHFLAIAIAAGWAALVALLAFLAILWGGWERAGARWP